VVSELGLGTATFGGAVDEPTCHALLDRAFDAGVTLLDTAETYPVPGSSDTAGASEEILGRWLAQGPRHRVLVAGKVAGPPSGALRWPVRGGDTRLDRDSIRIALEGSLRRLGTSYLDLFQTHRPDPDTPLDETLEALDRAVASGKVRAVGVCNESPEGLDRVATRAAAFGGTTVESVQCSLDLLEPRYAAALAPVCERHGVGLLGYGPLAGGVLSGKYRGGTWPERARFARPGRDDEIGRQAARALSPASSGRAEALAALAAGAGLALPTLAVAWALTQPAVSSVLLGATRPAQLDATLAASGLALPPDLLRALRAER